MSHVKDQNEIVELWRRGELTELVGRCNRLVEESRSRFGEWHAETATSQIWLAFAYEEAGDWAAAASWYDKALVTRRALFGSHSTEVVSCLNHLGNARLMAGRWQELGSLVDESMQIFEGLSKEERLECPDPAFLMAMIQLKHRNFTGAQELLVRALHHHLRALEQRYRGQYNWNDPELAAIFDRMSLVYRVQGNLRAAERTIRKAMRIHREGADGKVWLDYARMWRSLGLIQARQGNNKEARTSLKMALRLIRRCRPPGHFELEKTERAFNQYSS